MPTAWSSSLRRMMCPRTATPLRPAGKAQIGDDFLDVIAEGDYVQPGSRVQIIEIEGNRIVVKEI